MVTVVDQLNKLSAEQGFLKTSNFCFMTKILAG